jgi:protein arginine N-methyltransferase 1
MDYNQLNSHRLMIRDVARTAAFAKAIESIVKPGHVVLDVGAGSGVLSLLAARAGAARVYSVEMTPAASMAAHLASLNGFGDRITVLQGDIRSVSLPEKVDVIISEWMGTIGVDENMLGAVLWARDHFLKPEGILVPQTVTAVAAPAAPAQRPDVGFFLDRPFGLDLSPLSEPLINELFMVRRRVQPSDLAAPAQVLWTTNAATDAPAVVRQPYSSHLNFQIKTAKTVTALAAWFTAELAPGIVLANGPSDPDTHWGQLLLPLNKPLELSAGDTLEANVEARSVGPGPLHFAWKVRVNEGPWEHHDTLGESSPASSPAAPQPEEPPRSALSQFLAEVALDPELLADFLADADGVMTSHELSEEHRAALKSRDATQIQQAMYEVSQTT